MNLIEIKTMRKYTPRTDGYNRFIIRPSRKNPNKWAVQDRLYNVSCIFEHKKFSTTNKFYVNATLDAISAEQFEVIKKEITEWIVLKYANKV